MREKVSWCFHERQAGSILLRLTFLLPGSLNNRCVTLNILGTSFITWCSCPGCLKSAPLFTIKRDAQTEIERLAHSRTHNLPHINLACTVLRPWIGLNSVSPSCTVRLGANIFWPGSTNAVLKWFSKIFLVSAHNSEAPFLNTLDTN